MVDKTRVCSNSNHRAEKQIFEAMENLVTDYEKWVILPFMNSPAPKVVIAHTCLLGEGPVWDASRKTVCWVDILNGKVHEFSTVTQHHRKIDVKDMVGSIALCNNGEYIAALKTGLAFVHKDSGRIRMLHHPEVHLPGNRFNDGKCDPAGRFWVGGERLQDLYITSAKVGLSEKQLEEQPLAGGLFVVKNCGQGVETAVFECQ
jgi:sugar lactone lactonase YvrE